MSLQMRLFAFCCFLGLAVAVGTTIDLGYIKFTGLDQGNGVSCWLGLPYANPPLGEFRFKVADDPQRNPTPFQATTVGISLQITPPPRTNLCP